MKLLRVDIQDGESQYSEWAKCETKEEALDLANTWTDGFLRALRNKEIMDINKKEIEILKKFKVI